MRSRLDQIMDWEVRAKKAAYRTESLAAGVGVTRQQLNRYFRRRWGTVAHLWMERLRISDGLRLLRQGKLIKEIADELGFQHPNHFSRAFRRVVGTCPSELSHDGAKCSK